MKKQEGEKRPLDKNPINILLIEDNPDHVELVTRALKQAGSKSRLWLASDGQEALDFLLRRGSFKNPKPQLILLDLKLPKVDGSEILKQLKENPQFRCIPVVILTTSSSKEDINDMYALGANSYVIKPGKFNEFMDRVRSIEEYWTVINKLPCE